MNLKIIINILINDCRFKPFPRISSKHQNDKKLRKETGTKLLRRLQDGARITAEYVKYLKTELGLETFYQLPLQLILLLLARTLTKTTGGLEVVFGHPEFLMMSADSVLLISTLWSFKTCVTLHMKQINSDKVYLRVTSKIFVFFWGLFATTKRVMAIIGMFIPSMGLFSLLHHWQAEQIPFKMRLRKAQECPH